MSNISCLFLPAQTKPNQSIRKMFTSNIQSSITLCLPGDLGPVCKFLFTRKNSSINCLLETQLSLQPFPESSGKQLK